MEARSFAANPAGISEINCHQIRVRFYLLLCGSCLNSKTGSHCGRWKTVTDDRHPYVLKWAED
ncbi:hypothetical protein T12_4710 [Trichinella patagoniensis]|uniref:Uncharacterized protein n=1 Tax=Trichinella patagoniensis TaxID=990121 RepID=A0A0V0ZR42_9BILA|nr:hypothetical protein T12_4710 [Trichinella patagoniensis]